MCIFYLINKDQYYEFKVVINLIGVILYSIIFILGGFLSIELP
jgi:hypothetical protein